MKRLWRRLLPPVQATPSAALRLRTRLDVPEDAREILGRLGTLLGGHLGTDLAERCRRRHPGRTDRKRVLTELTSSRWAGAVTGEANRLYAAARGAQQLALRRTEAAIRTIQARLALPLRGDPHEDAPPSTAHGRHRWRAYASAAERALKQRRLQILTARAAQIRDDLGDGRVHICRGGKALARHRHYLLASGLTEEAWRRRWEAARWFIHANGEAGKRYGNETIRVSPDEDGALVVEIDLPPALAQYANAPHGRYRLRARAFGYRGEEWAAHVHARRACAYDITYDPDRGRLYLDASFTPTVPLAVPQWERVRLDPKIRVLGIDLNTGHLACAVLDAGGNPCGPAVEIPLVVDGLPAPTRDGHLRGGISEALHFATQHHCQAIACEFLDFEEARAAGREQGILSPAVRATILGMPTAQVRDRLVRMAARKGLAVIYVDAAYSSIWGAQYWQRALSSLRHRATRHQAAAVVLGRRALRHAARRRAEVTAPHQRMEAGLASANPGAEDSRLDRAGDVGTRGLRPPPRQRGSGIRRRKTGPGNGSPARAQALQDRSGAPRGLS